MTKISAGDQWVESLNITKIAWKQEKLWLFNKARNVLIKKRWEEGIKETYTTSKLIRCVREKQSCLMAEKPNKR